VERRLTGWRGLAVRATSVGCLARHAQANLPETTKIPGASMEKNSLRLLVVDDEEARDNGIRRALEAFGQRDV